jgi:hypothetical protein
MEVRFGNAHNSKLRRHWKLDQEGAWMLSGTPDERKLYAANLEGKSVSVIRMRQFSFWACYLLARRVTNRHAWATRVSRLKKTT